MSVSSSWTIKGWHVGVAVVAFFGVVVAVDAAFLVLAYRSHPGQVAGRPYEDGLVYNAQLARQRAQAGLGWSVRAGARRDGVVVEVRDRDGAPVRGLAMAVDLERPATTRGRLTRTLSEVAPGRYVTAPTRLSGAWDARIVVRQSGSTAFEAERRLVWR